MPGHQAFYGFVGIEETIGVEKKRKPDGGY